MDVAIVSCQECLFSKNITDQIRLLLEQMVTPDNQRIDVVLLVYDLRELDHHAVAAEVHRAKVQIVIISNHFLEKLRQDASRRKPISPVNRALRSKRVIAILAGIEATEIQEANEHGLARFNEWYHLELSPVAKLAGVFCKKFTEQVVKIYNVELSNNSNFSVFPKKATPDQPKIVIMLNKPLESEEIVKVEFARGGDIYFLDNVDPINPYTIIIRIPESLRADKSSLLEITLFVNKQKLGTKLIKYELQAKASEEDIITKMTKAVPGFQKLLDDHLSQVLSKNFRACTDWSLDPDLELMNDILVSKGDDFPTLMHFSAYYGLEKTVLSLLDEADGFEQCAVRNDVNETPLDISQDNVRHVIRDYQEMTMSWKAFQFVKELVARNSNDTSKIFGQPHANANNIDDAMSGFELTPSILSELNSSYNGLDALSESEDSTEILEDQEDFVDFEDSATTLSDVSSKVIVYDKPVPGSLVQMSSTERRKSSFPPSVPKRRNPNCDSKINKINYANIDPANPFNSPEVPVARSVPSKHVPNESKFDEGYDYPPTDNYKIPPSGIRPFNPDPPSSTVITPQPGHEVMPDPSGYLVMLPPENSGTPRKPFDELLDKLLGSYRPENLVTSVNPVGPLPPPPLKLDPPDEDLIEIMNDFKNNVYSMKQLELLFEHWKRRTDVKMSYQERQARLKQMRMEYNQIQEKLNRGQRRPSVLGKVLQFFNTGRKKASTSGSTTPSALERNATEPELPVRKLSPNQSQRKISNNSDRTSTGSTNSTGLPELENSVISKDRQVQWINPLTRKCVVSYVDPNILRAPTAESPQPQIEWPSSGTPAACEAINQSHHYQEPPPPRPFKSKASLIYPPSPLIDGTSPPRSPKPPPKKGGKAVFPVEKDSPPPIPPPRGEKTSPFRLINYEKRAPDGSVMLDKNSNGSWIPPSTNGVLSANSKQPYENDIGTTSSDLKE